MGDGLLMGKMSEGGSMNIFVLDEDPAQAARYLDDVRLPKMCVESAQMMASALRRHGATDEQMPD